MKKFLVIGLLMLFMVQGNAIPFLLANKSLKPIELFIPGVKAPNLSPLSQNGIDLKVGQKVYFVVGDKKILLFQVHEGLTGKKVEISSLIEQALVKKKGTP